MYVYACVCVFIKLHITAQSDPICVCVCERFFVIRGQVERNRMVEDGGIESDTHSSGMLFGITDAMLEM